MLPHAGDHTLGGKDALASAWVIETLTAKKQWSLEMSVGENWAIVTLPIPLLPTFPHHSTLELHSPQLLSEMSVRAAAGRSQQPRRPEMTPPKQSHGTSVCFNPKLPHWPQG